MRTTGIILAFIILSMVCKSQIPYYDAIELSRYVNADGELAPDQRVYDILRLYIDDAVTIGSPADIENQYQKKPTGDDPNPFIELSGAVRAPSLGLSGYAGVVSSSLGNLNVTNFAVGLSDFLIERGKAELNVAFFRKLEKWLDENPEAYVLFPKTKKYLSNIMSYEYTVMINTLRESFQRDLSDLPINLPKLFSHAPYNTYAASYPEIMIALESFAAIQNNYRGDPNELLTALHGIDALNPTTGITLSNPQMNYKNSLIALNVLSESVRSKVDGEIWIKPKDFQSNIVANSTANNLYIGLIYQRLKNKQVKFFSSGGSAMAVSDYLKKNSSTILNATKLAQQFLNNTQVVAKTIGEINASVKRGDKISREQIYTYVNISLDLVEYSNEVYRFATGNVMLSTSYTQIGRSGNDVFLMVASKQYGSAIMESVELLKGIRDILSDDLGSGIAAATNRTDKKLIEKKLEDLQKDMDDRLDKLIRFGTFMANVVQAESSEAVQAAIETAALPVGSSSMKKYSNFDVALQAYLGAAWNTGYEGQKVPGSSWFNGGSFFAPVGIGVTFLGFERGGSLGAFFSGIDVGAVVQYRLENPNSDPEEIQEIKLGYLVSPGVYGVYGAPFDWPLSFGLGAQYGPGLTTVTDESNVVIDPTWRYNFFLAIDIPVFTIFNSEKHKLK